MCVSLFFPMCVSFLTFSVRVSLSPSLSHSLSLSLSLSLFVCSYLWNLFLSWYKWFTQETGEGTNEVNRNLLPIYEHMPACMEESARHIFDTSQSPKKITLGFFYHKDVINHIMTNLPFWEYGPGKTYKWESIKAVSSVGLSLCSASLSLSLSLSPSFALISVYISFSFYYSCLSAFCIICNDRGSCLHPDWKCC